MRKKILITGGTGLVGTVLTQKLLEKGHEVVFLSRTAGITKQGIKKYTWDFSKKEIDITAFEGVSVLIHLAGTSVASKRWSSSHKKDIYESRIDATRFLVETIQQHNISLDAVLCASATGIYGMSLTDELMTEESQNATDFLAKVTIDWEKEIDKFIQIGIRTVKFRIGLVLAKEGGALPQLAQPIQYGVGAVLGSGKQYMSWLHIDDLVNMFVQSLENSTYQGVYNAVSSRAVTNKEMTKTLAKVLKKPLLLPNVPTFVLKMMLGEMGGLVVQGRNVSNQKIKEAGFEFEYDELEKALGNLLKK